MKELLNKTTIALFAALLALTLIALLAGLLVGPLGEAASAMAACWGSFAFVATLSLLGGLYTSGRTGRIALNLDLAGGVALLSALIPAMFAPGYLGKFFTGVFWAVVVYGGFYYLARCLLMFWMGAEAIWKTPRHVSQGLRLLTAALILMSPVAFSFHQFHRGMRRAHTARTVAEIRNMDLACTKLMSDAGDTRLCNLFEDPTRFDRPTIAKTVEYQSDVILKLLRSGRDADIGLKPAIVKKLATGYMQIENDPWGRPYRFYMGPLADKTPHPLPSFRCFRGVDYVYDERRRNEEETRGRGNPPADNLNGYPANRDLPLYIWSVGKNGVSDQYLDPDAEKTSYACNGGDDINNWDKQSGWDCEYGR